MRSGDRQRAFDFVSTKIFINFDTKIKTLTLMLKDVVFMINIACKSNADAVTTWPGTNVF